MDASQFDPSNFMGAPPVVNQPPQIFGGYSATGAPLPPVLSGPIFTDDSLGYDDYHDLSDPKRRRIARACDMCRKKKIRCDGKMPQCSHCQNYNTECIFTHVEKKRSPPKGAKYIEGLENRLGRMESLLRLSGLLGDEEGETDLGSLEQRLARKASSATGSPTTNSDTLPQSHPPSHNPDSQQDSPAAVPMPSPPIQSASPHTKKLKGQVKAEEEESDLPDLSDMMSCLVTNASGETRYFGSSSGFSIFSPKGIEWVASKTGDNSFQEMIQAASVDDSKWHPWRPEVFGDIFDRRAFKSLPPRDECLSLLHDYFKNFNVMFPLFHEPTFMHLVDKQYSDDPYDGAGWWASLNVALAIAYRIRIMSNQIPGNEETDGWAYFKNALGVLSELTLRCTDLLSVQALLGMSLFLQGTPNPQPSYALVAAAIRSAHSIGLHKRGPRFTLNSAEVEQRKRVFWIAYLLDKDICLRSGRPPMQDDDDWNVELPSEDPDDDIGNIPLADNNGKVNLFRLMCRFAVISSQVYNQLYSVKASKQSDGELLNTIGELDRELEAWKDSIPLDFRPEHEIRASHSPLIIQVVVLHFAYYNCLTTIHRMSVHHGYWSDKLSDFAIQGRNVRTLNPRVFSSAALCVAAARASIQLIKYIPARDFSCIWLILYYPISGLITIFANILQNPQDPRARSDLKLMEVVVNFLSRVSSEDTSGSIVRFHRLCSSFENIARVVLDRAEREMNVRQRRKHEREREKVEMPLEGEDSGLSPATSQEQARASSDLKRPFAYDASPRTHDDQSLSNSNLWQAGTMKNRNASDNNSRTTQDPYAPYSGATSPSWMSSFGQNGVDMQDSVAPGQLAFGNLADMHQYQQQQSPPADMYGSLQSNMLGSFQQPFLPQDLWSMPMTFEWDFADMSSMPFQAGGGQDPNQLQQ